MNTQSLQRAPFLQGQASGDATALKVPFFRPDVGDDEIAEVVATLRSGWLTSGPKVRVFEERFAEAVEAKHALALNSCTAALHLAIEALGLKPGQGVLVPTMTFAASAEVVRYLGAIPILVDCDPSTLNLDLEDAERKLGDLKAGRLPPSIPRDTKVAGLIPVHVGGLMLDVEAVKAFARRHDLWIVEDCAHAFPAALRSAPDAKWQKCGEDTGQVSCFSFYANKTITTGEGGMAVTADPNLANRMRLMALHGLSHDAWDRYSGGRSWDYRIVAPGYKYNLTDIAAAIGIHQLERAESMRRRREEIAREYRCEWSNSELLELPADPPDRVHSWHLFPIRLRLDRLRADRNSLFDALRDAGVACSVHWRPLHLHPYYQETFGWHPEHCPVASQAFERILSLPLFSAMRSDEIAHVKRTVDQVLRSHAR